MAGKLFETTVGEVCQVFDGPHATPTRLDAGPVFLGITSLNKGRIDLSASDHVSEEDFAKWTRRVTPKPGDVVFSYETKLGEAAIIPDGLRCCLGRRMGLMRPDPKKLDSRFLLFYYLGPEFQEVIRERTIHGSTVERLALIEFPLFPLRIPPLAEQKRIAHILGTLDDKIEVNRRMNATLEAMARALFKSWFVDFDPVRAKAAGQPTGLPQPLADLFPEHLEDSPLGHIPKGWEVKPLSDLCQLGRGASPRPINDYMNGEVPWVKIADATAAGGPFLFETKEKVKKAGAERSVAVAPGDLILSNSATCGVPMFVELHGCIHDGWLYFKNLRSISKLYLFHVLIELAEHLVHIADGSVQKNLNTSLVGQQNVLVPPKAIVDAFDAQATVWFAKMRQNGLESRILATLRDTLLPKLLSGELSALESTN